MHGSAMKSTGNLTPHSRKPSKIFSVETVKIVLKSGKDQPVKRFHPWIFSGAIKKIYGNPADGDIVDVYDNKDTFLGTGHYQPGSIAVRILSFEKVVPDKEFFKSKIASAIEYRRNLGFFSDHSTNAFRLVHAEGDNLPGLVADFYDGLVVLQMHSAGMFRMRNEITQAILELLPSEVRAVYDKSETTVPFKSGIVTVNEFLAGEAGTPVIKENGYRFRVDFAAGQKTGFFLDQRDNRMLLGKYSAGRKVLNLFGYTGGFSVYAMSNAELVHTVDSSGPATDMADENVKLNYGDDERHKSFREDAFGFLEGCRDKYDLIILDPPAFAKHNDVLANALQGYKRLNMKAIENVRRGGVIFTFSCSQVVTRENFRKSVFAAAANTGRKVRILHQLSQPPDHPVNIYHPESEYLKGLVLYVD